MMDRDQQETVSQVYRRFSESDNVDRQWTNIDEQMSILDWLDDNQLVIEASVLAQLQLSGNPHCDQNHVKTECFVPIILEAVTILIELYTKTKHLPANNRFVLQYYLAISQVGLIKY